MQYHMSVNAPESKGGSDREMDIEDKYMDTSMAVGPDLNDTTDSEKILLLTDEDRQQQIEGFDNEMTVKLTELWDIMATGGLNKSTKFIKDDFLVSQKTDAERETNGDRWTPTTNRAPPTVPPGGEGSNHYLHYNLNHNDNHKRCDRWVNSQLTLKSAETIYKNAVQKKISSSSEEEGVDITGDM